ncbi:MAG: HAD family hydrolase [Candidatus Izemoplasmatales bacterium]
MMKCIATDLDGTLLTSSGNFSKKTIASFQYLKEQGYTIVVASGRTDYELIDMLSPLQLEDYDLAYIISYNGVKTTHLKSKKVLHEVFLSIEDSREIIKMLNEADLKIHAFSKDTVYRSKDLIFQLHQTENSPLKMKDINMHHWKVNHPLYKILVYEDENRLNEFKRHFQQNKMMPFNLFKSHPRLLEFVALNGTKGDALSRLCNDLGIQPKDVIAFGDEENDISMLEFAGLGVAMGNAKSSVKEAANMVTLSNDFDGVSEVLSYYLISKENKL